MHLHRARLTRRPPGRAELTADSLTDGGPRRGPPSRSPYDPVMTRRSEEDEELVPLPVGHRSPPSPPGPWRGGPARPGLDLAAALGSGLGLAGPRRGRRPGRHRRETARPPTSPPNPRPPGPESTAHAGDEPAPEGWRRGSPGPLRHRDFAVRAWTGSELVVWGGDPAGDSGAAYDPAADRWRVIAPAPIPARCRAGVGLDRPGGARVGPGLPADPGAVARSGSRHDTAGAAYDPAADRWRVLPDRSDHGQFDPCPSGPGPSGSSPTPPGRRPPSTRPAAGGGRCRRSPGRTRSSSGNGPAGRSWSSAPRSRERAGPGRRRLPALGGGARSRPGRWRALPGAAVSNWPPPPCGTVSGSSPGTRTSTPSPSTRMPTTAGRPAGSSPVDFADCSPAGGRASATSVFAEQCGQGAIFRPSTGNWEQIPHPQSLAERPVWTGRGRALLGRQLRRVRRRGLALPASRANRARAPRLPGRRAVSRSRMTTGISREVCSSYLAKRG